MYSIISQGDHVSTYVVELYADKESDVATLPTEDFASGSTCLIGETS